MKTQNIPRFPLSEHLAHPHFDGGDDFSLKRTRGITPRQLRRAYSFKYDVLGNGMKIAIIAALDNVAIIDNMKVFCDEFSLAMPKMSVHYPFGRAENTSREWLIESSLDTQWAHVFAPEAEICVVFSKNAGVESLMSCAEYASKDLGADVVSMSFGTEESASDRELSAFMGESESVFVSSSGDTGCRVSFPSSSVNVVSVGGTGILFNTGMTRMLGEYAWNGSGGGVSDVFDIPLWQMKFSDISTMTGGKRGTPDVSMQADTTPGAVAYSATLGGWTTVGGSSLSAACFAGICACIKQTHPEIRTSSDMLSFLYNKAGGNIYSNPQYYFRDITVGKSGNCRAFAGWDFATGLGSPVIRQLLL